MAEVGWVNRERFNGYEVQENIYSGALRHREHRQYDFFHEWHDGKPPAEENNKEGDHGES